MEIKEFVEKVLADLVSAVDTASSRSTRTITLAETKETRTVEFDIAVSVEENQSIDGKAGIKVLHFVEAGGSVNQENRSSTVSRVRFGVTVDIHTKEALAKMDEEVRDRDIGLYSQEYT